MRSIYVRSLFLAFGLAALVALELLLPHGVDTAAPQPAATRAAHAPA